MEPKNNLYFLATIIAAHLALATTAQAEVIRTDFSSPSLQAKPLIIQTDRKVIWKDTSSFIQELQELVQEQTAQLNPISRLNGSVIERSKEIQKVFGTQSSMLVMAR